MKIGFNQDFCRLESLTLNQNKHNSEYFLTAVYYVIRPDGNESRYTIPHITLPISDYFILMDFEGKKTIDIGFGELPVKMDKVNGVKDVYAVEKVICKSLTKAEIEKILGYKIRIVEE